MFDVSRRDLLIRTLDLPESDLMICGAQDLAQRVLRHEYRGLRRLVTCRLDQMCSRDSRSRSHV